MPHLPRRTKQPLFHTSVRHHLKPRTSIASASRGTRASPWYIMTRGTAWQAMLPRRSLGKITSFLLYFLCIGLLHGMHVVLGWEFNWLYIYIYYEQYSSLLKNVYFCTVVLSMDCAMEKKLKLKKGGTYRERSSPNYAYSTIKKASTCLIGVLNSIEEIQVVCTYWRVKVTRRNIT